MRYIVAGYVVILGLLFLYAVQLVWRRRRLTRTVARVRGRRRRPTTAPTAAADSSAGYPS